MQYCKHHTKMITRSQQYRPTQKIAWPCPWHNPLCLEIWKLNKHVYNTFIPFYSRTQEDFFCEVWACALWDVANGNMVGDVLFGDDVDYQFNYEYGMGMTPIP